MDKTGLYVTGLIMGGLFDEINSLSNMLGYIWIAIIFMILGITLYNDKDASSQKVQGEKK